MQFCFFTGALLFFEKKTLSNDNMGYGCCVQIIYYSELIIFVVSIIRFWVTYNGDIIITGLDTVQFCLKTGGKLFRRNHFCSVSDFSCTCKFVFAHCSLLRFW